LREHHRSKREKRDSNVKKGDVVLVFDENLKRGFWKLGRIESLIVGRDEVGSRSESESDDQRKSSKS
jgi:hypothetical protein